MKKTSIFIVAVLLFIVCLFTLSVQAKAATKLAITKQPVSASAFSGEKVQFSLKATGDGLSYKWYYKPAGASKFTYDTTSGKSYYRVTMKESRDGWQIYCLVTDKYGNSVKSDVVTYTMKRTARITTQPISLAVFKGEKAQFSLKATGDGLTYKWYYKPVGATNFTYDTTSGKSYYRVTMKESRDGWQIYCLVTDKYGNSVKSNVVTLSMKQAVMITKQPVSASAFSGEKVQFSLKATGDGLSYKWYYKPAGASKFTYDTTSGKSYYRVTMKESRDGWQIYCLVTDKYGNSVKSDVVTYTMKRAATITKQPVSLSAELGVKAKFSIEATGDGLSYKWYYKPVGATNFTYDTTSGKSYYRVTMKESRDGWQIYCVVTDKYGYSVQSEVATLTMGNPLIITSQPRSVKTETGYKATVSVTATGDELRYQWYYKEKDGKSFVAATAATTSTYSVTMNSAIAGRQLYCVVTDARGATLQTNTITIDLLPYKTVYYGENNSVRCVELINVPFATADQVSWNFEEVGRDDDGAYGFATEEVIAENAPIVNWYYGDDTYLTQYKDAEKSDYDDLITGLVAKGYTIYSRSDLNGDCYSTSLTRSSGNCHVSYFEHTREIYLTVTRSVEFSPLLQDHNTSTQSKVISGAETKLVMLPSEDGGDCYVIHLKNGNFIVFDGGASKTLVTLLDYLEENTPAGQTPVIEAWFITHGHYDHCGWTLPFYRTNPADFGNLFRVGEAARRVRVNGVYFNQTAEQIWEQCVYHWRSDTPDTGYRTKSNNPWPTYVKQAVAKMTTDTGEVTPIYRPQAGQIYYFCGLQVEIPYTQEQIPFCDYQMDINASSTWYLVRADGRTFLDAGDTEDVNMSYVMDAYSPDYDVYRYNLDIMSIFHHGHNLYYKYRGSFRAPILFLPSDGVRKCNAEATTVYRYFTTQPGTKYADTYNGGNKTDGLGLECYNYGEGVFAYHFSTGKVTQIQ